MSRIILASGSPKRREILEQIGLKFEVVVSEAEELDSADSVSKLVAENAEIKVKAVVNKLKLKNQENQHNRVVESRAVESDELVVIGADTVVEVNGKTFFKPKNIDEAKAMFEDYKIHSTEVVTGLSLYVEKVGKEDFFDSIVEVSRFKCSEYMLQHDETMFKDLRDRIIDPTKSGGFSIEGLGAVLFDQIEGSFYNILGLPVHRLFELFHKAGISVF